MPEEVTSTTEVKASSDGSVKISVEKYNELLTEIATQKGSISSLKSQLNQLRSEPPMVNRTIINKTTEMAAKEYRVWGVGLMGLGASMFVIGVFCFRAGVAKS